MATDVGSDELSDTAGGEHNRLQRLGKYRIDRRIGAGGMGTVFLAVDTDLNRTVALKVLPKDRAANPVLVRRFKAEGQAAAQMEHPNIVRVFEAGEADGFLYMALEYVEGVDVYELVERRGVLPVKRSTDIIRQTTLALQHAHDKGIVHRDIKPSNLLIKRDGSVKLADMGLARSVDETLETNITRAGTTVGTVDYMSPEQARNSKAADVRSDIYSLGCTWYHMLTGHPPFPDGGMTNKLQAHAVSTRPDPRAKNDRVPEGIVAIIQRMMACKPDDRYQTPQELLDDLAAAGGMHRTVDESALAALAGDTDEVDEVVDDTEHDTVIRVGDIDEFDLAALKESGEYDAPSSASARSRPIKPRSDPKKKPGAPKPVHRAPSTSGQAEDVTQPRQVPTSSGRAFAPIEEDTPDRRQAAAPRSPLPDDEPPPTDSRPARIRDKSRQEPRRTKRGSVTRAGGAVAELPPADLSSQPVDGSTKSGIDLEMLKVVIPAALVIAILAGIAYALMRGGDSLGIPSSINPYADDQPQDSSSQAVAAAPRPASSDPGPDPDPPPADASAQESPQVAEIPFPGAEDAAAAPSEQPLIPGWVDAFRRPPGQAERSLVVRRRPSGSSQLATINEALTKLPPGGGIIEIDGDGPFRWEAAEISNRQRIRIRAADGRRPVIQLVPADDWTSGALVAISGVQLEFEGVHFVLVDAGPDGGDLFAVRHGSVAFRDCSITVDAQSPARTTALRLDGQPARRGEAPSGKCLLENVLIRGANLTSVALDGPAADLVAGNCLLWAGSAPAIVVHDTGQSLDTSTTPGRVLRLLASTVVSTQTALQLQHEEAAGPVVPTDVVLRNSLLVRPTAADTESPAAMTTLVGWPRGIGGLGNEQVEGLALLAEQTTFVGWSRLLTLRSATGEQLAEIPADSDAWRRFWNRGLRSDAVVAESIPLSRIEIVTPQVLHAELSAVVRPLRDGQLAGCRPSEFASQPTGLIEHVVAAMRQPYEPDWLGPGMPVTGEPVRFDLGLKRSLSRFLASDACPNGTHIIAFGSGLKELDPLLIENKSIRLEFEGSDKSPLIIQPVAGRDGAAPEEALITVRNGALDLVAAPLKLPASRRRTYPHSLILLEDASLCVRQSTFEGPRLDVEDVAPLIRTQRFEEASGPRAVLLEDSYLVSLGAILAGPVQWESLIVRNCVLVSESDAVMASVSTPDQPPASIVLDHCTIATGGAAIRAEVVPSSPAAAPLLAIHSRACIYAGSINRSDGSVVVAHSPGAVQNNALVWWGSLNGFSDRLAGSVIEGQGQPGDFARDWLADWGDGHEANSLTGKADVLFRKPLPDLRLVEPTNFQLADSATAATWGRGDTPIGAAVGQIGPEHRDRPSADPPQRSSTKPGTQPGRNNPGF